MVNPAIEIKNLSLGYHRESEVLSKLNVSFYHGELIGIAGLNGSGKSTLLKALAGILKPLSGDVFLHSKKLIELSQLEISKFSSIVLTEKISGFNLRCYDAVASGRIPYTNLFNTLSTEDRNIINTAIEACGISEHQEKPLSELSDGLFQKTMIAKCIAQQSPVMLLDEPSAFLDYASKHELFILLKRLAAEEMKCVLVSSHDLDMLLKYCDKILMVKNRSAEMVSSCEARWHSVFKELSGGYL
jgi:iron complex transport system ATP-binding protein